MNVFFKKKELFTCSLLSRTDNFAVLDGGKVLNDKRVVHRVVEGRLDRVNDHLLGSLVGETNEELCNLTSRQV